MRQTILERLKSPVVIGAIILALFNLATQITGVDYGDLAEKIVAVATALASVFAAMSASLTIRPVAIIATSSPSVSVSPLPISKR